MVSNISLTKKITSQNFLTNAKVDYECVFKTRHDNKCQTMSLAMARFFGYSGLVAVVSNMFVWVAVCFWFYVNNTNRFELQRFDKENNRIRFVKKM